MVKFMKLFICVLAVSLADGAAASTMVFQGQNAGLFPGANPSGMSIMMNSVTKPKASTTTDTSLTSSDLILRSLQSQISSKMYNDIFNGTADSGFYSLGNGSSVSYSRAGGLITVVISDSKNGVTTIEVPDI